MNKIRIGEICEVIRGNSPIMKTPSGKYPLVTTGEEFSTSPEFQFDCKAVCIPIVSATGHGHASIKRIHYIEGQFALGNILAAIISKDESAADTKFLYYQLHLLKDELLVPLMKGTANVSLTVRSLKEACVYLPSIEEQRAIVSKFDVFTSRFQGFQNEQEAQRKDLKALRATILDLAVRGKLVPQKTRDRTVDSYEIMDNLELPIGWKSANGKSVSTFVTSGSRGWAKYYSDTGPIFLRIGNLDYGTTALDLTSIQRVTPPTGAEGSRTEVQHGDILISITGDTGMVGLVPHDFEEAYINQHIALLRPSSSVNPDYLARFFTSPYAFMQLQGARRGIKNSLGLNDIRAIKIPLPPLEEQKRIVEKVDHLMAICDRLEAQFTARDALSEKLAASFTHSLLAA